MAAISELRQDITFALRQLRRHPGFALVAIFTLALGIGGTAAIFSVVNAVIVRPLPVHEPDRVALVFETSREGERQGLSLGNFTDWSRRTTVFSGLAGLLPSSFTVSDGATTERIVGARVTGTFFEIHGVQPMLGRTFGAAEDRPGRHNVVVLSHRLWTRLFGADPRAIGRELRLARAAGRIRAVDPHGARAGCGVAGLRGARPAECARGAAA